MPFSILENIIVLLTGVLVVSVVFRYLHLPGILGYLAVGALAGPHGLGWIRNLEHAQHLAEFGVVFLMFTVGLEFSLSRMITLRRTVFLLGGLQVIISTGITLLIGLALGMDWIPAFIAGGIVAMSSTAIVTKQLSDQMELNEAHGQNAIGILLFQDLAVILFLILIAGLANPTVDLSFVLMSSLIKGLIALMIIFALGRWLCRPLLRIITGTRVIELFTLTILLMTLAAAWLTNHLGLSYALGAFLAGMMLGDTNFRHAIQVEIRPFRDVLLGLFFITIGTLLDLHTWKDTWIWITLMAVALLIGKSVLIIFLSRIFGNNKVTSLRTGLVLAQGGEFGFAMLTLALSSKLLSPDYGQVILGALLLSIALAPLIILYNRHIAQWLKPTSFRLSQEELLKAVEEQKKDYKKHVILCGYGRVGQNIARLLEREKIDFLALDLDPTHVKNARLAGKPISYGDATHPEILKAAGIADARILVISFDNMNAACKILSYLQQHYPKLTTIVRCKDDYELNQLQNYGAQKIVVESHEESLMISYHLLRYLHVSEKETSKIMQNIRHSHDEILQQIFPGALPNESTMIVDNLKELRPVILPDNAYAVEKHLSDLNLKSIGVTTVSVRRGDQQHTQPPPNLKLQPHDILILYGTETQLDAAEQILIG